MKGSQPCEIKGQYTFLLQMSLLVNQVQKGAWVIFWGLELNVVRSECKNKSIAVFSDGRRFFARSH